MLLPIGAVTVTPAFCAVETETAAPSAVSVAVAVILTALNVPVGASVAVSETVRSTFTDGLNVHVDPVVFAPKSHTSTDDVLTPSPVSEEFEPEHTSGSSLHTKPSGNASKVTDVCWNVVWLDAP